MGKRQTKKWVFGTIQSKIIIITIFIIIRNEKTISRPIIFQAILLWIWTKEQNKNKRNKQIKRLKNDENEKNKQKMKHPKNIQKTITRELKQPPKRMRKNNEIKPKRKTISSSCEYVQCTKRNTNGHKYKRKNMKTAKTAHI